MRTASRHAGLYGSIVASLLLLVSALSMNSPATAESVNSSGESIAPGDRNFTIAGPEVQRAEMLIDGSKATSATPNTDTSRLQGEIPDDGEDAFDAMLATFEAKYPRLINFGGKSFDASGMRWVLLPEAPTADQIAILETYGHPLRVEYGTAPIPDEMRKFAGALRLAALSGRTIEYQGYGFNANHTGLEMLYTASPDLAQAEIEHYANELVSDVLKSTGTNLRYDIDFIEVKGPGVAEADITGGYGLTQGSVAFCTSGFTAVRNDNLGVITAKHCDNGLQYRGNAGSLEFGAPASDSSEGEVDMQFHKTVGSGNTTSKKYLHYDNDERFVTNVTTQVQTDEGETRSIRGAGEPPPGGTKTGFACALLSAKIGVCRNMLWPNGTTHHTCHLVKTTNHITQGGDSGGPWFDDTPGRAVGIHVGRDPSTGDSIFTNINRASINLNATVRTN